jgi:hypothetical protein
MSIEVVLEGSELLLQIGCRPKYMRRQQGMQVVLVENPFNASKVIA